MYEICNSMCRFTSRSLIFDATITLYVAVKNGDYLRIFVHNATNITQIENQRLGGESTHKITYFIHRSTCGAGNIQLLGAKNVDRSMEARPSTDARPYTDGPGPPNMTPYCWYYIYII